MRVISQLIGGISRFLQNLPKYFNGTAISTSFASPTAGVFQVVVILDLNVSELTNHLSAHLYNNVINSQMFSNNYHYIMFDYMAALQHLGLLHYLLGYYLFYLYSQ